MYIYVYIYIYIYIKNKNLFLIELYFSFFKSSKTRKNNEKCKKYKSVNCLKSNKRTNKTAIKSNDNILCTIKLMYN